MVEMSLSLYQIKINYVFGAFCNLYNTYIYGNFNN